MHKTAPRLPEDVPNFDALEPGAARCPGPSVQDILGRDVVPAPAVLAFEEPRYMGPGDVSYDRYYDPTIFNNEVERLWKRTWQFVCREEHIPEPGDHFVYEVVGLSFIVVRQHDGAIKGFWNSCLHRGTKLRPAEGFGSSEEFRCPFHGWRYGIDGSLAAVPCAWDFPHVKKDEFHLPEVKVETWAGFVFINPDENAGPLADYMAPMQEHFSRWDLEDRYISVHAAKELPCNWKAAAEAFIESYHLVETHPQLLAGIGDALVQYDIHSDHVSRFIVPIGVNSPHLNDPASEQELLNTMLLGDRSTVTDELTLKDGETARQVMARMLRKSFKDEFSVDLEDVSDSEMIDSIEYFLFPNMMVTPGYSLPVVYRFRPIGLDPERSLFEIMLLRPVPREGARPAPAEPFRVSETESYRLVPGMDASLAHVFDQDTDNLRAQQQGFRASKKRGETLGNYQEARIKHFEGMVDKYLAVE